MAQQAQPREVARDYCVGCGGPGRQTFAGWATGDGHENTCRPRAFYRICGCGRTRLVLADVTDAENLCRTELNRFLRGVATSARVRAAGTTVVDGQLDPEEGLQFLQLCVWRFYLRWRPDAGVDSFLSYATHWLKKEALPLWIRDLGEPSERAHGRVHPKAHAPSVSVSYDALTDAAGEGRLDGYVGAVTADHAEDRALDLLRALAAGGRRPAGDQPRHGQRPFGGVQGQGGGAGPEGADPDG